MACTNVKRTLNRQLFFFFFFFFLRFLFQDYSFEHSKLGTSKALKTIIMNIVYRICIAAGRQYTSLKFRKAGPFIRILFLEILVCYRGNCTSNQN